MAFAMLMADLAATPQLPGINLVVPVVVGVVVGLGAVGLIHYALRSSSKEKKRAPEQAAPDPFVHGSASEQRNSFRRQGNPVEVAIINARAPSTQFRGWVLDRSVGGLCLMMDDNQQPDTTLRVRPANAPPLTPWTEVVVKSCRESNHGHEVGCQFVKTPPWAILLMFG